MFSQFLDRYNRHLNSIALGLRMPEYERRFVISAAKVAGIASINEIIIGDNDNLTMRPIAD